MQLPSSTLLTMTSIGIVLAAHFALWITSLTKTSIASSVILVTAHPILVAPISHYFLKERHTYINTIGIILSMIGVTVLVLGNYKLSSNTLEGNILAMLGGIAAGLYILGGRKLRRTVSVIPYAFVVYLIAAITLLIFCLLLDTPIYSISIRDYEIILLIGCCIRTFRTHTLQLVSQIHQGICCLHKPTWRTNWLIITCIRPSMDTSDTISLHNDWRSNHPSWYIPNSKKKTHQREL